MNQAHFLIKRKKRAPAYPPYYWGEKAGARFEFTFYYITTEIFFIETDQLLLAGHDLLSHVPADAVSSALVGLTSGFGMEPGGPPPRQSPAKSSQPVL